MTAALPALSQQLAKAAKHEPANVRFHIDVLRTQLKNYAHGNSEDRIALKPAIADAITRLEAARCGR